MSTPHSPARSHDFERKIKKAICFLLVLIIQFVLMWNTQPRVQVSVKSKTFALSGDDYNYFLLQDKKWLIDSENPDKFIQIVRGDSGIDNKAIKRIGNTIQNTSAKVVYTLTELKYNAPIYLYVDSNKTTYAKELKSHFSADKATNEVNESLSIQYDDFIYFPFYKFTDGSNGELDNTLAHELTHVVLYQNGIEAKLPIWLNEGFAWYVGNEAEKEVNPRTEKELEQEIMDTISFEAKTHKLYNLEQNNTMFTKNEPDYNIEWEDYLAVKKLINQYGIEKFRSFISNLKSENTETDFQKTFGMSISSFERNFYNEEISITK